MKNGNQINYNMINDLYMGWLNESNPFMQRKRKEDIIRTISPYELLMYSVRYALPFEAFRNIFPLSDLFKTLEEMKRQGQDISYITNQPLVVSNIEDVQALNRLVISEASKEIGNFRLKFEGNNIFQYGDIKGVGKKFPNACANYCKIESVEQMLRVAKDYKGVPIIITIDNIGQLPLDKLDNIEKYFNVAGIRIIEKDRQIQRHQGEQSPINLVTYRQIRKVIDDEIINKLYVRDVSENVDRTHIDYHLASQIICKLADKIKYDSDTRNKNPLPFTNEMVNASGLMGLLTGKSICTGFSEILRNVLSCVDIKSTVIIGKTTKGTTHAWNQIQLGNTWFNTDVTFAIEDICEGKTSGDLFMSDGAYKFHLTSYDKRTDI